MLFINLIEANLTTRRVGRAMTYYPFTDSTNDDLWELLDDGEARSGQLVITDHQKAGRGRRNRTWAAAPGLGLTFSLLLYPDLSRFLRDPAKAGPLERLGLIALAAGVAVVDALVLDEVTAQLKWPNDILAEGRKLGGILIESRLVDNAPVVVLGIGLNVNEQAADFPEELRAVAQSVRLVRQSPVQRELLLARLLNRLEALITTGLDEVVPLWLDRCAHRDGLVRFHVSGHILEGQFRGIDAEGNGEIEVQGETRVITAGDLGWLPTYPATQAGA